MFVCVCVSVLLNVCVCVSVCLWLRIGLGGTCVNVGCIPKKLMHQTALLREFILFITSAPCHVFLHWVGIALRP